MKLCVKSLLLLILFMACIPPAGYASFPVKRAETRVINTNAADGQNAGSFSDQSAAMHHYSFAEKAIRKILPFGRISERMRHKILVALAIISVLCGGLGVQRLFLGYIGAFFVQLSGLVCLGLGVFLIVAAGAGSGAALLIPGVIFLSAWVATWVWSIIDLIRICTGDLVKKHRIPSSLFRYR